LVELLRARLGPDAVHGVQVFAEHRPEAAWRIAEPAAPEATMRVGTAKGAATHDLAAKAASIALDGPVPWRAFRRPLWLLTEPQSLRERNHQPCYRGPLRLSEEPERIETGWWDGKDISRDYYCATDVRGVKLWIYRDCATNAWFLHGFFG
jgi:protein ImuB